MVVIGGIGAYVLTQSHATVCRDYVYRTGSSGTCVQRMQRLLVDHHHVVTVDGQFGPKTRAAVIAVQQEYGQTQDGIVGKHTWDALCSPPRNTLASQFNTDARVAGCVLNTTR